MDSIKVLKIFFLMSSIGICVLVLNLDRFYKTLLTNGFALQNDTPHYHNSTLLRYLNKDTPVCHISHLWLTVRSKMRLGNQMFQYAFLYGLSKLNNTWNPYIHKLDFAILKSMFNASLSIKTRGQNRYLTNSLTIKESKDADKMLNDIPHLPLRNLSFIGYYQSHKFFNNFSDGLRKEFSLKKTFREQVQQYFTKMTPPKWANMTFLRVGIHVRRTDMISKARISMGVIPSPPSYFSEAMKYFTKTHKRVQFIIASDDLRWCQNNIKGENVVYSNHGYQLDFAILVSCDHVVISVGTFSWWVGYLCPGTTIYHGVQPPNGTYMAMMYANNKWIPPKGSGNNWIPIT